MILEDLLIQSGADYTQKPGKPDEIVMACPFCVGNHDVQGLRRIFGMNVSTGYAHCHRCDWGSKSIVYTARELCRVWNIDFSWRLRLSASQQDAEVFHKEERKEPEPVPMGLPPEYEQFRDLKDEIELQAFRYLRGRGITRKEIDAYKIGYAAVGDFAWRVIFPVIGDDDVVYGCSGRDFSGQSKLKYRNTEGIKILFNAQKPAKCAVVVEGAIDALSVCRVLEDRFEDAIAVGALGWAITHQQIAQLAKFDTVIHFPDFDVPGVKGAMARAEACTAAGLSTFIVTPEGMSGHDPGDMDAESIAGYLERAVPWTDAEKFRMRLSMLK